MNALLNIIKGVAILFGLFLCSIAIVLSYICAQLIIVAIVLSPYLVVIYGFTKLVGVL